MENNKDWLRALLRQDEILPEDIPDIGLYMDQVTTLMDTKLAGSKRYPDDKIMTKTMINNYTKNHLLPPSEKKKYAREHVFLLILIYYLKNMLSISDIQSLLEPLSEDFFPKEPKSGLSLEEIYRKILADTRANQTGTAEDILKKWDESRDSFSDYPINDNQADYLDDFAFIYQLGYEIYMRKQLIERLIDRRRERTAEESPKGKRAKAAKKKDAK